MSVRRRTRMQPFETHIDDRNLLLAADGELSAARASEIRDHLAVCPSCRMRNAALQQTLADAIQEYRREFDPQVPPLAASRRLLRARLAQPAEPARIQEWPRHRLAWAAAVLLLVGMGAMLAGWPVHRARGL